MNHDQTTATCTHRRPLQAAHCTARAVWLLSWSEPIADGWVQTTHRQYCSTHADEARSRLAERRIPFDVVTA